MRRARVQFCVAGLMMLTACRGAQSDHNADSADESVTADVNAVYVPEQELVFCPVVEARVSKADCDDLKTVETEVRNGVGAFNVPDPMTRDQTKAITLVVDRRTPEEIAIVESHSMNAVDNELASENTAIEANISEYETKPVPGNESSTETDNTVERPGPAHSKGGPTPSQIVEPLEGKTETLVPKVGRFMLAELNGDGFKIQPLSPASQEIPPGEQATWQWNVTPTQGGTHTLTLKTVVEGVVSGKRYPLSRTQTVRKVQVEVSWPGWFADKLDQLTRGMKHIEGFLWGLAALLAAALVIRWRWKNRDREPPKP